MSSNVLNLVSEETFVAQTEKIVQALGGGGESGGTPFRLLTDPETPITITNGAFSAQYEGEPPTGAVIVGLLIREPKGIDNAAANQVYFSAQYHAGTATVTVGQAPSDGVITAPQTVLLVFVDSSTGEFITLQLPSLANLPVAYKPTLIQPVQTDLEIELADKTVANTINLANVNGVNCIAPTGVNPAYAPVSSNLVALAHIYRAATGATEEKELTISGQSIMIPADTLLTGDEMEVVVYLYDGDDMSVISLVVK